MNDQGQLEATSGDLREDLAMLAHHMWGGWMRFFRRRMHLDESAGGYVLDEADVLHWERLADTRYADLTEGEKASDRQQADKMLHIMGNHNEG